MAYTNFPSGITSFNIPTFGVGGLPPFTGNYWFVNEATGSDGNPGTAAQPFASLARAQNAAVANNNDVVFVTGTVNTTATLNWAKNFVHMIGLTAPSNNPRARITQSGSATLFTPLVNVTAQGCIFADIGTSYGFANSSAQICWVDSGSRNFYSGVLFQGMGASLAAQHASSRNLVIGGSGNGEHVFQNCVIGLDTITAGANASLEMLGGTPRNTFRGCIFPRMTNSASAVFVKTAAANAIDRWSAFYDCLFVNNIGSTSTQMTVAFSMVASSGGLLTLNRCTLVGATKWGDTGALAQMYVDGGAPTAATTGLAVNPS